MGRGRSEMRCWVRPYSTVLCCLDLADVHLSRAQRKAGGSFATLGLVQTATHLYPAACHCLASTSASLEVGGSELLGLLILRAGDSWEQGAFLRSPEALHVWLLAAAGGCWG